MTRITLSSIFTFILSLLFIGCSTEEKDKIDNSNAQLKQVFIPKNKIGEILKLETTLDYTKVLVKTKIYEDRIFYEINLEYSPKILEVPDDENPTKKIKKDLSQINSEEWKKSVINTDKNYFLTLVFKDSDSFTLIKKDIFFKELFLDLGESLFYEGNINIDKSIASNINKLTFYKNEKFIF